MTQSEYNAMRDDLYFGREVELEYNGKLYHIEQCKNAFDIYLMDSKESCLITHIESNDKNKLINLLFSAVVFDGTNIESAFAQMEIVFIF